MTTNKAAAVVSEEMVLRACNAYDDARDGEDGAEYPAMHAALQAALGVGGWRPIAEAPRDGTKILAYLPDFDENAVLYRYSSPDEERSCWLYEVYTLNDCLNIELEPSHFMPIPPPPQQKEGME